MKKAFRIGLIIIAVFVLVNVVLFAGARYGWRLFGFAFCQFANSLIATAVNIDKDHIEIQGDTAASDPAYVGYIYKKDGDTLYIGLKYNVLFGFLNRDGGYKISIKCDTTKIDRICFEDK